MNICRPFQYIQNYSIYLAISFLDIYLNILDILKSRNDGILERGLSSALVFDNVGNGDYALEFWFNVNHQGRNNSLYRDANSGWDIDRSFGSGNNSRMENYYIDGFKTENNGPQWSYGMNGWKHYVLSRNHGPRRPLLLWYGGSLPSSAARLPTPPC